MPRKNPGRPTGKHARPARGAVTVGKIDATPDDIRRQAPCKGLRHDRAHRPILRDPEIPDGVECLVTESTYGDRLHGDGQRMGDDLAEVVNGTHARGGKIVIPSFALERAQEVV